MKSLLTLALVVTGFAAPAAAQTNDVPPQLVATGRGQVSVKPTRASISFMIQTKAPTASQAASQNAETVASVIRALRAAGARESAIVTAAYNVTPNYEASRNERVRTGFVATTTLRADSVAVAEVGRFIDAGLAGGATSIGFVQFAADGMEDARRDALRRAVAAARSEAETLAEAAGGRLGRLLTLTSSPQALPYPRSEEVMVTGMLTASSGDVPTQLRPGDLTVTAIASGRWEFVPLR